MPEAAVGGARVVVEVAAEDVGGEFVAGLVRFLVEDDEEIGGEHVIEGVELAVEMTLRVDVGIDPRLDVVEIARVVRAAVDEVLAEEIEGWLIAPAAELCGIGRAGEGGIDQALGPLEAGEAGGVVRSAGGLRVQRRGGEGQCQRGMEIRRRVMGLLSEREFDEQRGVQLKRDAKMAMIERLPRPLAGP